MKIVEMTHICDSDANRFFDNVMQGIECMQNKGLTCELQYSTGNQNRLGTIIYTVLIIGRIAPISNEADKIDP